MFQVSLLRVSQVRFTPDVQTLSVVHHRSHRIAQIDLLTGGTRPNRRFDWGPISRIAHSPDGQYLAIGTATGNGQVFRNADEQTLANLVFGADSDSVAVSAVQFSRATDPKRCWLAIASSQLILWNPYSQEYIFHPDEGDYRGAAFGPDGSFVASIEAHAHHLTVWNVKPFRMLFRTELTGLGEFTNGAVAVLPDGERIVYAAGDQLRCVSMAGEPGWEAKRKKPVIDLAMHPNGKSVLLVDGTKGVTQIDTANGQTIQQFDWGVGKVSCVDYSTDGTLAAAGGEKGQIVVWDGE
jgi:WD40 repeat protein